MQDNAAVGYQIRIQHIHLISYLGTFRRQLVTSVFPHKSWIRTYAVVPSIYVWNCSQSWFGRSITPYSTSYQLACPKHISGTPAFKGHWLVSGRHAFRMMQVSAYPVVWWNWRGSLRWGRGRITQGRWWCWQRFVLFPHHTRRRLNNTVNLKKKVTYRHTYFSHDQKYGFTVPETFSRHHKSTCQ